MSIIERMKNCEGCRKRRRFLKEVFGGIAAAIGLALLWPFKEAKAQGLNCDCIFCPGGQQFCLCCDPFCQHCWTTNSGYSMILCEFCSGRTRCTGIGCDGICPPGFECTSAKEKKPADKGMSFFDFDQYWRLTLTNDESLIIGSNEPDFDAMVWFNAHKVTDKDGNRVTAKASHKLPLSKKA